MYIHVPLLNPVFTLTVLQAQWDRDSLQLTACQQRIIELEESIKNKVNINNYVYSKNYILKKLSAYASLVFGKILENVYVYKL